MRAWIRAGVWRRSAGVPSLNTVHARISGKRRRERGGLAGFGSPSVSAQIRGETGLSSRPRAARPAEPVSLP